MSVGKKLKVAQAEMDVMRAEVALMRAEHRLKMAAEDFDLAAARLEVERLAKERDTFQLELTGAVSEREELLAQVAVAEELAGALKRTKEFLEYCEVAEDRSNLDGDDAETVLRQINEGAETGLAEVAAALAKWDAAKEGAK